jgi:hypothetical protein
MSGGAARAPRWESSHREPVLNLQADARAFSAQMFQRIMPESTFSVLFGMR